jgi:hypothetical protein
MLICPDKAVYDFISEIRSHVIYDIAYAKLVCYRAGILDAAQTAARLAVDTDRFIIKKSHSGAGRFKACLAHQVRGHTRIYTAAHSHKSLFHTVTVSFLPETR